MNKNLLKNFFLSLASLFLCLFLLEVGFRILSSSKKVEKWQDRPLFYYTQAGARTLRSSHYSKQKPEGSYRIAVVGDSFSFSPYMQYDDAFPKRLERMLNLQGKRKVEVVNLGVPGYSTSHEVRELRKFVMDFDVDLVILQMTLNDPEFKPMQPKGITVLTNPYSKYDASSWTNPILKHWKSLGFVAARIHNYFVGEVYRDYYVKLYQDKRAMNLFNKSLVKVTEICESKKVPVVAVVFPLFGYNLDESYPFQPMHETIHSSLDALKIPYLDLFGAFKGGSAERLTVLPGEDFHPNEIAHRIAAEELYTWLLGGNRIPQDIMIESIFKDRVQIELKHATGIESSSPPSRMK